MIRLKRTTVILLKQKYMYISDIQTGRHWVRHDSFVQRLLAPLFIDTLYMRLYYCYLKMTFKIMTFKKSILLVTHIGLVL